MRSHRFTSLFSRRRFAAMLVMTVLWAQWLGLEHAVVHAFGSHQQTRSGLSLAPSALLDVGSALDRIFGDADADIGQDNASSHHSCAAFDTATLAASAPATLLVQPVCPFINRRAEHRIPEFYLPLFAALFNSRAPPSSSHPA